MCVCVCVYVCVCVRVCVLHVLVKAPLRVMYGNTAQGVESSAVFSVHHE